MDCGGFGSFGKPASIYMAELPVQDYARLLGKAKHASND